MKQTLGSAIVTGSVAALAIVANVVTAWRTTTNQRQLAREQRAWDAVRGLYVDLLAESIGIC